MTYFSGNGGWGGILAVDISDPRHPFSTWSEGGYQFASPTWSGSYLCASISHRVKVYGLSDPAHPAGLGDLASTTLSPPVALAAHYMYFQTGTTAPGLELVDITDPTVPTVAGNLELPRPAGMIALTSRWVFVSDSSEVLVAYRQCDDAAVGADVTAPLTRSLTLEACAPNPFRGATRIAYALPSAAPVRLDVYDVAGRHVRTLVREAAAAAGHHMTAWDGSADGGRPASVGVYFLRLRAGGLEAQRRVTRLR
jgi:hypothetical protein